MVERRAEVGGIGMRWHEAGDGIPVVLIHGIPTSPALWRHVVPRLRGARCLAWEMVGYGASIPEGRERDISVSAQADYLLAWLKSLGIERVTLAGHDLGGGVAQIAAVRNPAICAGIFLTNAIGYDSWPIPSVKAMQTGRALLPWLPNAVVRANLALLFRRGHDNADKARGALHEHWPHYERNGAGQSLARQVAALDVRDTLAVADDLPQLGIPARIVWGAADQFQKLEYGERFARDLNAPLRRVDEGKHFTPEDHSDIVAEELQALIDEIGSPPGAGATGRESELRDHFPTIRSLPEVMPQDADPRVSAIYEDIQRTLRVPFVNQVFRLLANDPEYLEAAWRYVAPVARSRDFERAAGELRGKAVLEDLPHFEAARWQVLGDTERVRRFTDSIQYVLPKLLLVTSLLDPESRSAAGTWTATSMLPPGVAEAAEKIEMVDPNGASEPVRRLLEDILNRHGHPAVATYFRSLGHWPELLEAIWEELRPIVGQTVYREHSAALVEHAFQLAAGLRPEGAPPAAPSSSAAVLGVFRRRIIPDLLVDATLIRRMLGAGGLDNPLDLS